jgi:signal transduction histidine kinase/DNA-binding NarL/FixJ family response regulator
MTIKDLVPREDLELVDAFLAANPGGAQPDPTGLGSYGRRHQYKDGTIIDVDVASVNLTLGGRSCRLVLYQDITERKRTLTDLAIARDEAVEASNIKSAFLANVSHEVRTPMNGVIGMTELLLGTDLTAEQREYTGQVWRSGEQMLGILDDILDISKIEAGHLELDRGDFDLRGTVGETCSISGSHASAKGLRMTVHFDDNVPRSCHGDGRRLAQVVRNLLSNAIKFTSEGTIVVHVSARHTSPEASLVRVEISDTGIGIEPAQLERIFEPFTQADASTTRLYGGTGLGLTIAREIVEMMGGAISGRSEPGRGSTFWLEVELGVPTGVSPEPRRPDAVVAAPPWAGSPLLLVAEDSPVNQVVAARALERCGYRSHLVASGREAVEAFASGDYEAVLMDCQMPGLDGYRATAEMRAMERDSRRTPIIAMTARALAGDHERCIEAGMDDHISKPMHHAELLEKLTRWIPNDRERRLRPAMPASPPRMLSSGAGGATPRAKHPSPSRREPRRTPDSAA